MRMKIGLLANSNLWLEPFYHAFIGLADVQWATFELPVFQSLVDKGYQNVCFVEDTPVYDQGAKKYRYQKAGLVEFELEQKVCPDIWITDNSSRLSRIEKNCMWVQAFHSFCYKTYNFHSSLINFDLLLLPGKYHYNEYLRRMSPPLISDQLAVTGFPKLDLLSSKYVNSLNYSRYELDPEKPTVLYAPTWGGTTIDGTNWHSLFWPRWQPSEQIPILECFLQSLSSKCNIIIKLHHCCPVDIKETAKKLSLQYHALWIDDSFSLIHDPFELMKISDCLISDMSGIIPEFLFLNKPVVFIDPDVSNVWDSSSIPSEMRPGPVVTSIDDLISCVEKAIQSPKEYFADERHQFLKYFFEYNDYSSAQRAKKAILKRYHELKQ